MEIWKPVLNHEGTHEVSNYGRVRTKARIIYCRDRWGGTCEKKMKSRILRQYHRFPVEKNYPIVELFRSEGKIFKKVHRLVAEAFIPNPNNYPVVMHIDNNTKNSCADNLMWGTHKMNGDQKEREGRANHPKGVNQGCSKLTEQQVIEIRKKYTKRKNGGIYALAKEYGVVPSTIQVIVVGKNWSHLNDSKL